MQLMFEIVMCVFLDAAMLVLALTVFREDGAKRKSNRLVSSTFSIGFLCGIFKQFLAGGNVAVMVLLALGFVLACAAFLRTFSGRNESNESR